MKTKSDFDLTEIFEEIGFNYPTFEVIQEYLETSWIDESPFVLTEKRKLIAEIQWDGIAGNEKRVRKYEYWLLALPLRTLQRGHLKKISLKPPHWFKKGVTYENLNTWPEGPITDVLDDAETIFSLPCGYAGFVAQKPINVYDGELTMFDFPFEEIKKWEEENPGNIMDWNRILSIYEMYVFFHELSHVYAKSMYHWRHYTENVLKEKEFEGIGYKLSLPSLGIENLDAKIFIESFKEYLKKYPCSFGDYSAGYKETGKDNDDYLWLHENLADASAAFFMGIVIKKQTDKEVFPSKHCLPDDVRTYLWSLFHSDVAIIK